MIRNSLFFHCAWGTLGPLGKIGSVCSCVADGLSKIEVGFECPPAIIANTMDVAIKHAARIPVVLVIKLAESRPVIKPPIPPPLPLPPPIPRPPPSLRCNNTAPTRQIARIRCMESTIVSIRKSKETKNIISLVLSPVWSICQKKV